ARERSSGAVKRSEPATKPNGAALVNTTWSATKPWGDSPLGARAYGQNPGAFVGAGVGIQVCATKHSHTMRPMGPDGGRSG
ncbi:MAG TPA: hypothetical protein VFA94_07595, partial [Acidimicrobiales bacterium]|nr:hypothetical protein [Acidimicrobiales bacterium]